MDSDNLQRLLSSSLSSDSQLRTQAVAQLEDTNLCSRLLPAALSICSDPSVDSEIRLAAAIHAKQTIRKYWRHPLTEQHRLPIRHAFLQIMLSSQPKVRIQLADALRIIIAADFPHSFPANWLHSLIENLLSQQENQLSAALLALRVLSKVYEGRVVVADDDQLQQNDNKHDQLIEQFNYNDPSTLLLPQSSKTALHILVQLTFPILLQIMNRMNNILDQNPNDPRPYDIQKTICKIFWSCTNTHLPSYLLNQQPSQPTSPFYQWMHIFLICMKRPIPVITDNHPSYQQVQDIISDPDSLRRLPHWKVKQWVGHIIYRLFQRYTNPSRIAATNPSHSKLDLLTRLCDYFRRHVAPSFTTVMLDLLSLTNNSDSLLISPRVANLALLFLEAAAVPGITYKVIRPRLSTLLTNILLPMLCISQSDLLLWSEDPLEYVRKTYDAQEDFHTPRTSACSLLYHLARSRRSAVIPELLQLIVNTLEAFDKAKKEFNQMTETNLNNNNTNFITNQTVTNNDSTCPNFISNGPYQHLLKLAQEKDGALLAIGTVRDSLLAVDPTNTPAMLDRMLTTHVLSDFSSQFPFLRARACWLYGQFIATDELPVTAALPGLEGLQRCLMDSEFPVRVRAAVDIRHFLQNKIAAERIAPGLPDLLQLLFKLLDDIDNTDIVATIDQVVVGFSDQIAPVAAQLCERLVEAFIRAASIGHPDEEAGFAATQCIQALESIVTSVAVSSVLDKVSLLADIEKTITKIFDDMFKEDRIEYFEVTLELLSTFVYHSAEERGLCLRMLRQVGNESFTSPEALAAFLRHLQPIQNHSNKKNDMYGNRSSIENYFIKENETGETSDPVSEDYHSVQRTDNEDPLYRMYEDVTLRSSMLEDAANCGGVISPYLWSLFPKAMYAFHDWASDYSFQYLHLVDSYLSKCPRVFLANSDGTTPFIQLLLGMISRLWDESSLHEDDLAIQGSRVCSLFLQHCWQIEGISIESEIGVLTRLAVRRMQANPRSVRAVTSLLQSLAHLLYVGPMTALTVIDKQLNCTTDVFNVWMTMVREGILSGTYDRKVSAIALSAILGSDWNSLPVTLRKSIPQLVLTIVGLLESLEMSNDPRRKVVIIEPDMANGILNGVRNSNTSNDMTDSKGVEMVGENNMQLSESNGNIYGDEEDAYNDVRKEEFDDYNDFDEFGESLDERENPMFCILNDVDELLFFESVVQRLPPAASQQLMTVLAADETRRIQCALHRAAELRNIPVHGVGGASRG